MYHTSRSHSRLIVVFVVKFVPQLDGGRQRKLRHFHFHSDVQQTRHICLDSFPSNVGSRFRCWITVKCRFNILIFRPGFIKYNKDFWDKKYRKAQFRTAFRDYIPIYVMNTVVIYRVPTRRRLHMVAGRCAMFALFFHFFSTLS